MTTTLLAGWNCRMASIFSRESARTGRPGDVAKAVASDSPPNRNRQRIRSSADFGRQHSQSVAPKTLTHAALSNHMWGDQSAQFMPRPSSGPKSQTNIWLCSQMAAAAPTTSPVARRSGTGCHARADRIRNMPAVPATTIPATGHATADKSNWISPTLPQYSARGATTNSMNGPRAANAKRSHLFCHLAFVRPVIRVLIP